jgi:hypothetical protein
MGGAGRVVITTRPTRSSLPISRSPARTMIRGRSYGDHRIADFHESIRLKLAIGRLDILQAVQLARSFLTFGRGSLSNLPWRSPRCYSHR